MTIELYDHSNTLRTLEEFKGKKVVLFFYPKDNTPGCTKEAVGFSDNKAVFDKHNVELIGVSKDSVKSHQNFINKFDLKVTLLSDPDIKLISHFDVWKEKKNYGKTYMGIVRTTIVLDEEGTVIKRWDNVKVKGHVDDVIEFITQ
jgi:peroxiredoxin Q/BCP